MTSLTGREGELHRVIAAVEVVEPRRGVGGERKPIRISPTEFSSPGNIFSMIK